MLVYHGQRVYQWIPDPCDQLIRLRRIAAEHTNSSWADSICVLEDFQEITLDSQ